MLDFLCIWSQVVSIRVIFIIYSQSRDVCRNFNVVYPYSQVTFHKLVAEPYMHVVLHAVVHGGYSAVRFCTQQTANQKKLGRLTSVSQASEAPRFLPEIGLASPWDF